MDSFFEVEFVKHRGPELWEVCFLRVNGTHALFLSDMECPNNGWEGKKIGYWGDDGLTLVPICCEELPVFWHKVETDHFTLAAWKPKPGIHYLSLVELSEVSVFKAPTHYSGHSVFDDFRRALVATVEAEQRFSEISPEQWDQQAWRGFYKQVAALFGVKLFLKPLGALVPPFCRIIFDQPGMDLVLEDQSLRIELSGDAELEAKFRELIRRLLDHEEATLLCDEGFSDHLDARIETLLIGDLPEEDRLTIRLTAVENFIIQQNDGRVDFQQTLTRLLAAGDFLIRESRPYCVRHP